MGRGAIPANYPLSKATQRSPSHSNPWDRAALVALSVCHSRQRQVRHSQPSHDRAARTTGRGKTPFHTLMPAHGIAWLCSPPRRTPRGGVRNPADSPLGTTHTRARLREPQPCFPRGGENSPPAPTRCKPRRRDPAQGPAFRGAGANPAKRHRSAGRGKAQLC